MFAILFAIFALLPSFGEAAYGDQCRGLYIPAGVCSTIEGCPSLVWDGTTAAITNCQGPPDTVCCATNSTFVNPGYTGPCYAWGMGPAGGNCAPAGQCSVTFNVLSTCPVGSVCCGTPQVEVNSQYPQCGTLMSGTDGTQQLTSYCANELQCLQNGGNIVANPLSTCPVGSSCCSINLDKLTGKK